MTTVRVSGAQSSLREPQRGDEIWLFDPIRGAAGSFITHVARIRSSDADEGVWEVLDQYGTIRYIRARGDRTWDEVEVDF